MLVNTVWRICNSEIQTGHKLDVCEGTNVLTPSGALTLPVIRRSQASLHSLMTSRAYFLFLHSPLKAKEFSGLPSGIYC